MDIKLPNGALLRNVPEGISEDEIARVAILNGLATEDDYKPKEEAGLFSQLGDRLGNELGDLTTGTYNTLGGIVDILQPDPRPPEVYAAEEALAGASQWAGDFFGVEGLQQYGAEKTAEIAKQYAEEDQRRAQEGLPSLEQERQGQLATRASNWFTDAGEAAGDFLYSDERKGLQTDMGQAIEGGVLDTAGFLMENPEMISATFAQSIPPMLIGAGIGKVAGMAGKAVGMGRPAAIAGSVGGEAGVASAMNANDVQNVIMQIPDEELMQLPEAQLILEENPEANVETVRNILRSRASNTTFATSLMANTLVLGASQALGANVVQDILTGTRKATTDTALKAGVKGFLGESGQEYFQESGDAIAGDLGEYSAGLIEAGDVGETAAASGFMGAVVGGPTGGMMNAATADTGADKDMALAAESKLREGYNQQVKKRMAELDKLYGTVGLENKGMEPKAYVLNTLNRAGFDGQAYLDLIEQEEAAATQGDIDTAMALEQQRKDLEDNFFVGNRLDSKFKELLIPDGLDAKNDIQKMLDGSIVGEQTVGVSKVREADQGDFEFKLDIVQQAVRTALNQTGLKDVQAKLLGQIGNMKELGDGTILEGIRRRNPEKDATDIPAYGKNNDWVIDNSSASPLGLWDTDMGKIFLSTDLALKKSMDKLNRGKIKEDQLGEDFQSNLLETLDHEKIHALKALDLFKQGEWDVLAKAAKNRKRESGETYYEWAKANYSGRPEAEIIEESIADLIRGEKKIGGKPRTMINRIKQFFESLKNVVMGSGYNSFEKIFGNIETGKIGGRKRGVVRTYDYTEKLNEQKTLIANSDPRVRNKEQELQGLQAMADLYAERGYPEERLNKVDQDIERITRQLNVLYEQGAKKLGLNPPQEGFEKTKIDPAEMVTWHGSGALFDRFKTSHIGEGEGQQVRGWGLYFGQEQETGQHYYDMLGGMKFKYKGKIIPAGFQKNMPPELRAAKKFFDVKNLRPDSYEWEDFVAQFNALDAKHPASIYSQEDLAAAKKLIDSGDVEMVMTGALYQVEIPDSVIDAMLDLDKPINQQSRQVQSLAKEVGLEFDPRYPMIGEDLRDHIESMFRGQNMWDTGEAIVDKPKTKMSPEKSASLFMLERGITGNKFDDGWSKNPVRKILFNGVDVASNKFQYPKDFTIEDEIMADRHLANIEQGMALDAVISRATPKLKSFLNKLTIEEPKVTQNFVVFDENDIDIISRNGKEIRPKAQVSDLDEYRKQRRMKTLKQRVLDDIRQSDLTREDLYSLNNDFGIVEPPKSKIPPGLEDSFNAYMEDYGESAWAWENLSEHENDFLQEVAAETAPEMRQEALLAKKALGISEPSIAPMMQVQGNQGNRRSPLQTPTGRSQATFSAPEKYSVGKILIEKVQDKLVGLKDIESMISEARIARGERKLAALDSAYVGEELSHDRIGEKAKALTEDHIKPLIDTVQRMGLEIKDVDQFLVLRHAIERNDRVRKRNENYPDAGAGMMNGELLTDDYVKQEMLNRYGMTWDAARGEWLGGNTTASKLKNVARLVDRIKRNTLEEALEGGLINTTERDTLRDHYKYYAPLRGFGEDSMSQVAQTVRAGTSGSGGSMDIQGRQAGRATGRSSESYSPLATIISDAERTISRSVKNKDIGGRLFELIENNPNPEVWEIIGPGHPYYENVFDSRYTYVGNDLSVGEPGVTKKADLDPGDIPADWTKMVKTRTMETVRDARGKELLGIKRNGEQYWVDIKDDRLRSSLGNLNPADANWVITGMGKINRFLSFVNTTLNPEFVIGNLFRDAETGIMSIINEQRMEGGMLEEINTDTTALTKEIIKNLPKSGKVFYKQSRGKPMDASDEAEIKEFLDAGAKAGWFHSKPPEDIRADLEGMLALANAQGQGLTGKNAAVKSKHVMETTKKFVEDFNAAVENAIRFSTFKVAKREFMTADPNMSNAEAVERAASMAKNMTINFNRKGSAGNLLNSMYLFFNAQVQGTAVVLRGVVGSPVKRKIMGSITAMGALMAMLADAGDDDDEGLEDVEDFVRERNMVIPGWLFGMDGNVTIPLPYGYNVFYQLGSNAYMMAKGKMSVEKGSVELMNSLMGSFNPLGAVGGTKASESLIKMIAPTAFTPIAEIGFNNNYFGGPVYKENIPYGTPVPASYRSFKNTAGVFKWLTEGLNDATFGNESEAGLVNLSPDTLSYLFGYALGGAGKFMERSILKPTGNIVAGKQPFEEYNDVPFVRRLVHEVSDRPDMEAYYDRWDKIRQKKQHLMNVTGNDRRDYVEDNRIYFQFEPVYKQVDKQLKVLRQRKRLIQKAIEDNPSKALELSENQQKIDDAIDMLINRVNRLFEERNKG